MIRPQQHISRRSSQTHKASTAQVSTAATLPQRVLPAQAAITQREQSLATLRGKTKNLMDRLSGRQAKSLPALSVQSAGLQSTQPLPMPSKKHKSAPSSAAYMGTNPQAVLGPVEAPWLAHLEEDLYLWLDARSLLEVKTQLGFVLAKGRENFVEEDFWRVRASIQRGFRSYHGLCRSMSLADRAALLCNLLDAYMRLPEYRNFDAELVLDCCNHLQDMVASLSLELVAYLDQHRDIETRDTFGRIVQDLLDAHEGGGIDNHTHYLLVGCKAALLRSKPQ